MKTRVDSALVSRGIAASREKAQALIMAGQIYIGEKKVLKASETVEDNQELILRGEVDSLASRGGHKIERAITVFGADVTGVVAMDIGAAAGGFTDVLLRHGLLQERFSALLTDSIRAAVLEDMGYTVDVIKFIDFAHSPKNLMLRCVKDRRAGERNLSAARELAEKYGFRQTLLELAEKKCHSAQNTAF